MDLDVHVLRISFIQKQPCMFDDTNATPHPQCMPDEYKCDDPVLAYRKYYVNDKKDIAKWERSRPIPNWYKKLFW